MKTLITVLSLVTIVFTAGLTKAQTIDEIAQAYATDTPIKRALRPFEEALNDIRAGGYANLVAAKNTLIRILQRGDLTENRKEAVQAALHLAEDKLDFEINRRN